MNPENYNLLRRTNAVVLHSQPIVRKARSQELKTVLVSGPLTVVQVKTVKGKIAYMFKSRPRKYAYEQDFKRLASRLLRCAYPEKKEKMLARTHRYRAKKRAVR